MNEIRLESDTYRKYGINILTGEADALSMRLLCELDAKMMQTYLAYTGFQIGIEQLPKSNYNEREKYSCFLTWEVMEDLLIMRLMEENEMVVEILPIPSEHYTCNKFLLVGGHDELREYLADKFDNNPGGSSFYKIGRSYLIYQSQPRVGFSNVHAFTGTHQ